MNVEKIAFEKGYRVDKNGNVFNSLGKQRKLTLNKVGYYVFSVRIKMSKNCYVHRLVAYQKFGDIIYHNYDIRHLNNIKTDNSFDNIDYGTKSQNMMDIPEEERKKHAKHAASFNIKYNKNEVINYYNECKSYKLTMEYFGISSKGTLYHILNK